MVDWEPLLSVDGARLITMSRATFYIVVKSVCCAKIKGVDLDKEEPDVTAIHPGGEEGVRDDGT